MMDGMGGFCSFDGKGVKGFGHSGRGAAEPGEVRQIGTSVPLCNRFAVLFFKDMPAGDFCQQRGLRFQRLPGANQTK